MSRNLLTFQTNFSAGQVDDRMFARSDTTMYQNGADTLLNSAPEVQGGARRRPGTEYLATLQGHSRLERLQFSEGQLYVFAFSNARLDIYDEDGASLASFTSQPWDATTMWVMRLAQSGDTTIIVHKDFAMLSLVRTGASSFTMSTFAFEAHSSGYPRYQPYYKFADDSITLTPSATTGSITLTTSAAYWTSDHAGSVVRYGDKEIDVDSYSSSTVVNGTVRETLGGTSASTDWDENVFSAANGYARSSAFDNRRLWFGGTRDLPKHMFSSKTGAFFNFDVGTALDNESIQAEIATEQVSEIRHLSSGRHLQIFTDSSNLFVPESSTGQVTPGDFNPKFQTPYGCNDVVPVQLDGATLFVQDTGKVVREYLWSDVQQAYTADAVSLVSNDLLSGVSDAAVLYGHSEGPEQLAVFVNSDGTLAVYHSIRRESIAAWFPWSTSGTFESVTYLNSTVYASVKRTINSSDVYYLERFDWDTTIDSAIDATDGAGELWTGLTTLEAEDVAAVEGNIYHGSYTVSSGGITLQETAAALKVGLDFTRTITDLPVDLSLPNGDVSGMFKKVNRVVIVVNDSVNFAVEGQSFIARQVDDDLSQAPAATDGRYEFYLLGYDRTGQITITQDAPLPLTVLGIWKEVFV